MSATLHTARPAAPPDDPGGLVIALTGPGMGSGDDRLGLALLASFVRLLGERDPLPVVAVVCYNAGVRHLTHPSPLLGHLQALSLRGVEIIACRTCVEYLGLEDALMAGRLGTMLEIQVLLLKHRTVALWGVRSRPGLGRRLPAPGAGGLEPGGEGAIKPAGYSLRRGTAAIQLHQST